MTTIEQIKAARNALYDSLPIGEVGANAFDLIKLIKEHLCKLDEIVDTTPSPDVAGSDALDFMAVLIENYEAAKRAEPEALFPRMDKKQALVETYHDLINIYGYMQAQHPQPAGASVAQLCPKCQGQGIVSRPPWIAADVESWSGNQAHYECDVCNGNKILKYGAAFQAAQVVGEVDHAGEREVMIAAFDKVRKLFEKRSWIMEGRGSYRYDDDRYKEEVRYLYDEFDALQKETWANIKSKTFEYRQQVIQEFKATQPAPAAVSAGTIPAYLRNALDNWEVAWQEFNTGYRNVDGQTTRVGIAALSQATNQADTSLRKAWHQAKHESAPGIPDVRELVEALEEWFEADDNFITGKPQTGIDIAAASQRITNAKRKLRTALAGIKRK